jgi:hypothetical protein
MSVEMQTMFFPSVIKTPYRERNTATARRTTFSLGSTLGTSSITQALLAEKVPNTVDKNPLPEGSG